MTTPRPRRRWLILSIRGLLVAITAVAVGLGAWLNSVREQQAAVDAIKTVDDSANVIYEDEDLGVPGGMGIYTPKKKKRPWWLPASVEATLGRDHWYNVTAIAFGGGARGSGYDLAAVLRKVARLRHLDQLNLYLPVGDDDVRRLAGMRSLTRLNFGYDCPALTDEGLRILVPLPSLEDLAIWNAPITDAGLAQIARMSRLKRLELGEVEMFNRPAGHPARAFAVTDAGLAHLAGLTGLESLHLVSPNVTGEGLKHLAPLKRLKVLRLDCPLLTDDDLRHLAALASLESLDIATTRVVGTGFEHLKSLPRFESLCLAGPGVSDAAIPALAGLPRLESLMIYNTAVTAAGLESLGRAPRLNQLGLNPGVSGDAKRLKAALPNCAVINGGQSL